MTPVITPAKHTGCTGLYLFGGIYRDCWLIAHRPVFITDPNFENEMAGGGLSWHTTKFPTLPAEIILKAHIRNDSKKNFKVSSRI